MLLADMRKAENAELAKGMADKLYDEEIRQMAFKMKKHEGKMKSSLDHRIRSI